MPQSNVLKPDVIKVEVVHHEEIAADRADLYVTIRGSSLVTGNAALQKAREVSQLVADLKNFGLQDKDIHLEGVHAEVSSGILSKSSAATYSLRIHCANLDALADVLGIATAQKNTQLSSIVWGYKDDDAARDRWLATCLQRANDKARVIASGLNVALVGIHNFAEQYADPESPETSYDMLMRSAPAAGRARRMTQEDLGMEVSHSKKIDLRVEVEYRVSEFVRE